MSRFWNGVMIAVACVVLLSIGAVFGYNIGEDWGRGALECENGVILSLRVSGVDEAGNGTYALDIGDCDRIEEAAFIAAVQALAGATAGSPTTTTTTVAPTTTVPEPEGAPTTTTG